MVIYAELNPRTAAFGGVSDVPSTHAPNGTVTRPPASGALWIAPLCGSGMPMSAEAAARLRLAVFTTNAVTTNAVITTDKQRDAFSGVSPGLRSTSPPV